METGKPDGLEVFDGPSREAPEEPARTDPATGAALTDHELARCAHEGLSPPVGKRPGIRGVASNGHLPSSTLTYAGHPSPLIGSQQVPDVLAFHLNL